MEENRVSVILPSTIRLSYITK